MRVTYADTIVNSDRLLKYKSPGRPFTPQTSASLSYQCSLQTPTCAARLQTYDMRYAAEHLPKHYGGTLRLLEQTR